MENDAEISKPRMQLDPKDVDSTASFGGRETAWFKYRYSSFIPPEGPNRAANASYAWMIMGDPEDLIQESA
jgi:hypothetical protein